MPEDIPENSLTKTCPNCGKDVRVDANFCKYCANQFDEDEGESEEEDPIEEGDSSELDECPDCGADLSRIPSERLSDCPICGTDLAHILEEPEEAMLTPADLEQCPDCAEDLTSIPEDMRLVCPNCRVDLEEAIDAAMESHDAGEPEVGTGGGGGAASGRGSTGTGGSGRDAGAGRGRSTGGGTGRGGTGRASGGSRRAEGAAQEDIDAAVNDVGGGRRAGGGVDREPRVQREPEEIIFEVMGQEIRARGGDKVGREIRTAMVEAGASEDDAVYIHREHARVDKEGDEFYLARIGENSLKVNGKLVGENQRMPVSDGDQVAFSEVVTANVRIV
ncbi:hypothetical protein BRD00_02870 [Halobacteriales archaeon QS_8_69_26]|nr:MAG: hypothetical protein BRD00_02870 [Halobacteriales archaeon QS_8_69_26]